MDDQIDHAYWSGQRLKTYFLRADSAMCPNKSGVATGRQTPARGRPSLDSEMEVSPFDFSLNAAERMAPRSRASPAAVLGRNSDVSAPAKTKPPMCWMPPTVQAARTARVVAKCLPATHIVSNYPIVAVRTQRLSSAGTLRAIVLGEHGKTLAVMPNLLIPFPYH